VLALEQVPMEQISSYGCVAVKRIDERVVEVTDMVENRNWRRLHLIWRSSAAMC